MRLLLPLLLFGMGTLRAAELSIASPDFTDGGSLPGWCAYHGENHSPSLNIRNVPAGTKSLVLIMDDPDAPPGLWTHWVLWNLSPETTLIPRGTLPSGALQGRNSFGNDHYDGPAPPSGTHRYFFHLLALDSRPELAKGSSRKALESAIRSHVLTEATCMGTFTSH
jgi:Raf kinase inhibitor-like YbhB/YbcL family protein